MDRCQHGACQVKRPRLEMVKPTDKPRSPLWAIRWQCILALSGEVDEATAFEAIRELADEALKIK